MFDDVSNFVNFFDATFIVTLAVSVFFLVLITFLMIFFVIKYNRKRNPRGSNIHGHMGLEIAWTAIPTIMVLIMFWFGWIGYMDTVTVPENAMPINVSAQMWKWGFEYEDGRKTDTLFIPVSKPVKLILHSNDVNHSFFIPEFRVKKDVFPSYERIVWFIANQTGEFYIACAEYCGMNHSNMYAKVLVLSEENFNNWRIGMNKEESKLLEGITKSN